MNTFSRELEEARAFVGSHIGVEDEHPERYPAYHVTGGVGWINDPNGFSTYRGEYHLFFQYYPFAKKWGSICWGHEKSDDFIKWERLPVALAPDSAVDRSGCWSGSAVEMPDGRQLLLYTGMVRADEADTDTSGAQVQCVAIGDGVDYEKLESNPVIGAADLPTGGDPADFRDPKLWREGDRYLAVIGNRLDDDGAALLYESGDALHWRFQSVLARSGGRYGRMWECPDFFPLGDRYVLLVSPQDMVNDDPEFYSGGTIGMVGRYEQGRFAMEQVRAVDHGLDFYASQTTETPDGRRVMIAWMQSWAASVLDQTELPFIGQMTVPRELSLREGRLVQNPVRELERYRGKATRYSDVKLSGATELPDVFGRVLDMTVTLRRDGEAPYRSFRMEVAKNREYCTAVSYDPERGVLCVDRSGSGFTREAINRREFSVRPDGGRLKLRVLLDRWSMELFVNDGEQAASCVLYTPQEADGICFAADGNAVLDLVKYDLTL